MLKMKGGMNKSNGTAVVCLSTKESNITWVTPISDLTLDRNILT